MKVLIIRTDRLGDTVLASPVWQSLKAELPEARVSFLTRAPFVPLFENDPLLEAVIPLPAGGRREIDGLARTLGSLHFDALLALYVDSSVRRLLRKTSSPIKAGPLSKPLSWFLFNRPLRQRRSESLVHEAEYNGRLLGTIGATYRPCPPRVHLGSRREAEAQQVLDGLLGQRAKAPFVVVHPGMGGSALNWPTKRYASLVQSLLNERPETVVLTGTEADLPYLGALRGLSHPRFVDALGRLDLVELAQVLQRASLFIGPSTGPMHLATALGTAVVTLFSPLRVQHRRRWGPYLAPGTVLSPSLECPERLRCRGRACPFHDCMDRIATGDVLAAVASRLDQNSL